MAKKNEARKKEISPHAKNVHGEINAEKILIENFVSLQKVMTNLAVKFDSLSMQISKLLELFEISAKTIADKGYSAEEKKISDRMDMLLDQNKVIAKGIALLHEREMAPEQSYNIMPVQMQRVPQRMPAPVQPAKPEEENQRSVMESSEAETAQS